MIYVGVDPGVFNGVATWDPASKKLYLETLSYVEILSRIMWYGSRPHERVTFVVEDPSQNAPVFEKHKSGKSEQVRLKIAQDIGGNKRGGLIISDWAKHCGLPVRLVRPMTAKWDLAYFKMITAKVEVINCSPVDRDIFLATAKEKKIPSQHSLDAAKLVFGL